MSMDAPTPIYGDEGEDPVRKAIELAFESWIAAAVAQNKTDNMDPDKISEAAKMGFCLAAGVQMVPSFEGNKMRWKTVQNVGFIRYAPDQPWRVAVAVDHGMMGIEAMVEKAEEA